MRYGSVAIDISYFIFCCTDGTLRERLQDLLVVYHSALLRRLSEFKIEADAAFTIERLFEHMKKYGKFGFGEFFFGNI